MKNLLKSLMVILVASGILWAAGHYAPNGYRYLPQLTTQGTTDYAEIIASETATDAWMAATAAWMARRVAYYGDTGYTTFAEALSTIGSNEVTLVIPSTAGAVAVADAASVPANVYLLIEKGAYLNLAGSATIAGPVAPRGKLAAIPNGGTLTITGPIEAGPWQLFTWTGTGKPDLSGSPTVDVPIEWFGAVNNGSDSSTAFNKVDDCVGTHQWVVLKGTGYYKISSPVTWPGTLAADGNYYGFGLRGDSLHRSIVVIDVGTNVGFYIGTSGRNTYHARMQDINFIGAANACTNAVVWERINYNDVKGVNFLIGSTDYAAKILGAQNTDWELSFGLYARVAGIAGITYGNMANNLYIGKSGSWATTTYNRMKVLMSGTNMGTYGIYCNEAGNNWSITGDIENTQYAIYVKDSYSIRFENMHLEGSGSNITLGSDAVITGSRNITLSNFQIPGKTGDGPRVAPQTLTILNSHSVAIEESIIGKLVITPECYNVTVRNIQIAEPHGLIDLSGNLQYIGGIKYRDASGSFSLYGDNRDNVIANSLLNRWKSNAPDGWGKAATTTWTKCGIGQSDTTRHAAMYSAKAVNTAESSNDYTLSAAELRTLSGNYATAGIWLNCPSGQTFTNLGFLLYLHIDAPAWTANTVYTPGQAVEPTAPDGYQYVCVATSGDAKSGTTEPAWSSYSVGQQITDHNVTWVKMLSEGNNSSHLYIKTEQSDGLWRKIVASVYVPTNVSAGYIRLKFYPQSSGNSTFYIAEPSLNIGMTSVRGIQQGKDEHESFVQIGAQKVTWGSAVPGAGTGWHQQGDLHYNTAAASGGSPGWVCTASGLDAAAVWTALVPSGYLEGTVVWNPASLADGTGETKSLTVTGAALGDYVIVAPPYDLQDLIATAYVQSANTVEIRIQNESGSIVDLVEGTWKVRVLK